MRNARGSLLWYWRRNADGCAFRWRGWPGVCLDADAQGWVLRVGRWGWRHRLRSEWIVAGMRSDG